MLSFHRNTGCALRCNWHDLRPDDANKIYDGRNNITFTPACTGGSAYKDYYTVYFIVDKVFRCKDALNNLVPTPEQNGVSYSPTTLSSLAASVTVTLKFRYKAVVKPGDECSIAKFQVRVIEHDPKNPPNGEIHHGSKDITSAQTAAIGAYQYISTTMKLRANNDTNPYYRYGVHIGTKSLL